MMQAKCDRCGRQEKAGGRPARPLEKWYTLSWRIERNSPIYPAHNKAAIDIDICDRCARDVKHELEQLLVLPQEA